MRVARLLLTLLFCAILVLAQVPENHVYGQVGSSPPTSSQPQNLRYLKVNMGARSVWSDGGYYIDEMVNGARSSGYDAVFFADNALQFGTCGELADPGFEDLNSTGYFSKWYTNVAGPMNVAGLAGPFTLANPPNYYSLQGIHSGTHSLHLTIQSKANSSTNAGYAFARDEFPDGYSFNQTSIGPSHPLLLNDITFSAWVRIDTLGYVGAGLTKRDPLSYTDNGWFYLKFYFVIDAHGFPRTGVKLTATIIFSDHTVDDWLRSIRSSLNSTQYGHKVVYEDAPPLQRWLNLNVNVTDLARTLFNETVAENWRLANFEIGVRSVNSALVDVFVDDVSIGCKSLSPLDYFNSSMQSRLSTANLAVYAGYSLTVDLQTREPSLYAYGAPLGPIQDLNLSDPTFWRTMTKQISSQGGMIVLGPVYSHAWRDYLTAVQAFDVPIIDGTTFSGIETAASVIGSGGPVAFTATRETTAPTAYNSTGAWSVRVLAENNSEAAILDAIARGRAFLAVPNYTGSFQTTPYGFPMGRNPTYVPSGGNASLTIAFSSLGPGLVRVYQGTRLALIQAHTGTASMVASLPIASSQPETFFVSVTSTNDSLALLGNPLRFIQASMIPGGALFIDNDAWSVQSTQWTTSGFQQRMQLVLNGPAGTTATAYLFSPDFRPDAKSPLEVARFITVDNSYIDPASVYDAANSTFQIPVRSAGMPIVIILNFDYQQQAYWYDIFQSVAGLYILAAIPLAVVALYSTIVRGRKTSRTKAKSSQHTDS